MCRGLVQDRFFRIELSSGPCSLSSTNHSRRVRVLSLRMGGTAAGWKRRMRVRGHEVRRPNARPGWRNEAWRRVMLIFAVKGSGS